MDLCLMIEGQEGVSWQQWLAIAQACEHHQIPAHVGIGAGWHRREHDAYGFAFRTPRERTEMLDEQLAILVGSWGDEPFSFTGEHYRLHELDAQPKPVQRPHPPIILGGNAATRGARLAATYADEYNTPEPTLEDVIERRSRIAAACERAGRPPC